jgi:hypothetical protein
MLEWNVSIFKREELLHNNEWKDITQVFTGDGLNERQTAVR